MARTFDSQRLRHQRSMDRRLTAEHRQLARAVAAVVLRAAGADGTIPNRRSVRTALSEAVWTQAVKLYYIGRGDSPLRGDAPQSPYARLLYDGVQGATRIAVERQAALLRRIVRDEAVLQWLTGTRPVLGNSIKEIENRAEGLRDDSSSYFLSSSALFPLPVREIRGSYDPWHLWVDPNGYRLSDRIWRTGIEVRSRVDALLDFHLARGTAAVDIAQELEQFLTPAGRVTRTVRPYGREGSYAARRLARTEITRASGQGTIQAAQANPFVGGVQWRLSASHPKIDICDEYARGGPNGDGIYPVDSVPTYPPHCHCLCSLLPVPAGNVADLVADLRADIRAATPRARAMQGLLNPAWLAGAIMGGFLDEALEALPV